MSWFIAYSFIGYCIRAAMVPVVLRRQFAPGAAIAWLGIVFLHPYVGSVLYALLGENRLKSNRIDLHRQIIAQFRHLPKDTTRPSMGPLYQPMVLQAERIAGMPMVLGNTLEFFTDVQVVADRLIQDIDAAKGHVHLLYYIFAPNGCGKRVFDATIRAAGRGVKCRVLADAIGSRPLFNHVTMLDALSKAGVELATAMPVTPFRRGLQLRRMDLRNHRKLAIIDDSHAYAGSHNIIDADYDKSIYGPWVDLSARFSGPVVGEFASVFLEDWAFETGNVLKPCGESQPCGTVAMQVVPTGPALAGESYRRLLLGAVQSARSRVILTTPYFVPDDPTVVALLMAADRGVNVKLIVPQRNNSRFSAAAGRAHFGRLLEAGVGIYYFQPGLLHTKSTTVDDAFALFGSANLDVRSFNLNFELSVLAYDAEVTERVRKVQEDYLKQSRPITMDEWAQRSSLQAYADGAISLLSPLL